MRQCLQQGFKITKGQPAAYRELRSERGHKFPSESHLRIPQERKCHFLSVCSILFGHAAEHESERACLPGTG